MRRITLEAMRMSGLVDDMLRLARLDQHPGREDEPVDLSAVLRAASSVPASPTRERTWHATIDPGLVI